MAIAGKDPSTDILTPDVGTTDDVPGTNGRADVLTDVPTREAMQKTVQSNNAASANGSVRVEIFDQIYNLRGSDGDYILKLAEYVDSKMRAVSEQTATVDSVRLAVLAALNIADEYHLLKRRVEMQSPEARQRANNLASALDEVLQDTRRTG